MTTKIDWPLDNFRTLNLTHGCSPASPGCRNCYAARFAARNLHHKFKGLTKTVGGRPTFNGTVRWNWEAWEGRHGWRKPRNVFVCSQSDLCHGKICTPLLGTVFAAIGNLPQHRFFILTKRPARLLKPHITIPDNCWVGVSVEDKRRAHERLPILRNIRAAHKFVSFEPLLNGIGIIPKRLLTYQWAIVGGESGPGARPMHEAWLWNLLGCHERAGIPVYVKQLGRELAYHLAKNDKSRKGNQPEHWPKWAQVRKGPSR